ncbi:MAG: hypothetical protein H6667_08015 [Ardenticatenaceae bacterium]|nr:hypothetical protein [Ardenticatenaceae bacterium]MCB9444665.1 hypothetical protein [Ardenticatenaceae bacterium]
MITIQKHDVTNWLMIEYLAASHAVNEKLRLFERKYAQTWEAFSQELTASSDEDFTRWDDYIEWKAYIKTANDLATKMKEVKRGNFEIA